MKQYSITSQQTRMLLYANVIALDLVCGTGTLHWFVEFTALKLGCSGMFRKKLLGFV
jgi:hypothetical protein